MNFAVVLFLLTLATGVAWLLEVLVLRPRRRRAGIPHRPWWIEYTAGLFPVFIVVFLLRSFLFEPFKIPSGSMIPTLLVGDLILVNKYTYGVRLPIVNTKLLDVGSPARGDAMVFRYPLDPSVDYIKRVVGLPDDTITIRDNQVAINGDPVAMNRIGEFYDVERNGYAPLYSEKLGEINA